MKRIVFPGLAVLALVLMCSGGAVLAADQPQLQPQAQQPDPIRYGGDIRIREEYYDKLPTGPIGPLAKQDYFRFRTRLWGEGDLLDNVTFRARMVNEFRLWNKPEGTGQKPQALNYDPIDEFVFDELYLDFRDLLDKRLSLRIGRQEFMDEGKPLFGSGKLIYDGTAEDGSRTLYFNAVRATWKGIPKTTVDLLGIYNPPKDEIAINSADRDLTGLTSADDDMTESGAAIYLKNKSVKECPFEAYVIYKNESEWKQAGTNAALAWQSMSSTTIVENPALDLFTVGFRVTPDLAPALNGTYLEAAYQFGNRDDSDVTGYAVDADMVYQLPFLTDWKPAADAGLYYLSGDDPGTKDKDEGWNPLWARNPQYSELYVCTYRRRWSNLMMPHAGFVISPLKRLTATVFVGQLSAPEKDGPGGGSDRGLLAVAKADFTIGEKLFRPQDKLTAHLWLETLDPGDYYKDDADTAIFARWNLIYAF